MFYSFIQPPTVNDVVFHVTLENIQTFDVEKLQMENHWIFVLHHPYPFHCAYYVQRTSKLMFIG